MKQHFVKLGLIAGWLLLAAIFSGAQTKEIALTIDDLPLNGPSVPSNACEK